MADYYVNWGTGDNGNNGLSWGTAWATIAYALTQMDDAEEHTINVRGGGVSQESVSDDLVITQGNNLLTVRADDRPDVSTGTWPLLLTGSVRFNAIVELQRGCLDGFNVVNTRNATAAGAIAVQGGAGADALAKKCRLQHAHATTLAMSFGANYSSSRYWAENCMFDCSNGSGGGISMRSAGRVNARNCTFLNGAVAGVDFQSNGAHQLHGCAFVGNTADAANPNSNTGLYNGTDRGTAEAWGTNWQTGISATPGVDFVNPATGDMRLTAGSVLRDYDQSGSSPADDAFDTSRPQGSNPDTGYHEYVASGPSFVPAWAMAGQQHGAGSY